MYQITKEIKKAFELHANPLKAAGAEAYMRNQFTYLGISSPDRKEILKPILQNRLKYGHNGLHEEIIELWDMPYREYKYAAMELAYSFRKLWTNDFYLVLEELIRKEPWWDTVDYIAPTLMGLILVDDQKLQSQFTKRWMKEKSFWFHRTAIIFQLKYKEKTNCDLLFSLIERQTESKEFFIQKAIGWSLRQYARTNADWVKMVCDTLDLKPFSRREAMKHL